jgi:hypothetical protein
MPGTLRTPHLHNGSTIREVGGPNDVRQLLTPGAVSRMTPAVREARASPGQRVPRLWGTPPTWSPTIR